LGLTAQDCLSEALAGAGYTVLYRFANTRQAYIKDGFTIDFDRADYEGLVYCLCEVEMLVESVEQTEQALNLLYAFVKQYGISTDRAEGKLGYFMRVTNPIHYQAVINSAKHQA
jgi:adenylate cyclase class IV